MRVLRGSISSEMELLCGDGDGDGGGGGYGYGDGDGGYGYGDGDGDGDGGGYGYGYGYGDGGYGGGGYGDGGYGGGYGYGGGGHSYGYGGDYGHSYGDGDGGGDGDNSESIVYWMRTLPRFAPAAEKAGAILAYWRSHADGTPANGGGGTKARVGLVEEISGPLAICTKNALHGTLDPPKWRGDRLWIIALYPPWQFQGDKVASLKREFIADASCPLGTTGYAERLRQRND